jgi:hypothetical protein
MEPETYLGRPHWAAATCRGGTVLGALSSPVQRWLGDAGCGSGRVGAPWPWVSAASSRLPLVRLLLAAAGS